MKPVTTRFRSGHDDLDRQLRLLLTIIRELHLLYARDAVGAGDPDLIDDHEQFALGYYERYRQEQEYAMERSGYPALHKHLVHHRKFIVQLKEVVRSLASSAQKRDRLGRWINEFVRLHVHTLDKDLACYQRIRQREFAGEEHRPLSGSRRAIDPNRPPPQ